MTGAKVLDNKSFSLGAFSPRGWLEGLACDLNYAQLAARRLIAFRQKPQGERNKHAAAEALSGRARMAGDKFVYDVEIGAER